MQKKSQYIMTIYHISITSNKYITFKHNFTVVVGWVDPISANNQLFH